MSYRIEVDPEAGEVLRTLRAHVVQQLGRLLADLAELVSAPQPGARVAKLEMDGCEVLYELDRDQRTLSVRSVRARARDEAAALA